MDSPSFGWAIQPKLWTESNTMNRSGQASVTRKMKAVESNLIEVNCCEKECGMTILVDKSEHVQGRKIRCVACTMRSRLERP